MKAPVPTAIPSTRIVVRRDTGIGAYEAALARGGFRRVAGADEAGRGACAGPLVVAACILPPGRRGEIDGLTDSKLLTRLARERIYRDVVRRASGYAIVVVPSTEIDAWGLHVANLAGMRRALGQLYPSPQYALTDGFPVPGLNVSSTAVWKGDATVACIAAASVLAKVTRDAIMADLHERWPEYSFDRHKGYVTESHARALAEHGPCPEHRHRYVNVKAARRASVPGATVAAGDLGDALGEVMGDEVIADEVMGDNVLDDNLGLETA